MPRAVFYAAPMNGRRGWRSAWIALAAAGWMAGGVASGWAAEEAAAKAAGADEAASAAADAPDAAHGRQIFETICSHCHNLSHETSSVGAPGLMDVLDRRDEAWIEQWITSPERFAKVNDAARKLIESNPYGLVMPTLPETQSAKNRRDIIAFLKTLRSKK